MLTLSEIEKFYPEPLRRYKRFILREYLQYKILQIVFDSPYAGELAFLGETCLRIVYGNNRFSEDVDFDNFIIKEKIFGEIAVLIEKKLAREGYTVEMKTVYKNAFHCYIRFPELLYREGLSDHREEKILIQLDTEPQHYKFVPEKFLLNRFDVFTQIFITPKPILLAQKFYAVLNRPRSKGRDFFDIVFLLSLVDKPDYGYLDFKAGIPDSSILKERLFQKCASLNMEEMALDVAPFLFNPSDSRKITHFTEYIQQVKL